MCFRSERGLVLDCRLGFGPDLGTLDPASFARFVASPLLAAETVGLVRDDQETAGRLLRAPAVHRRAHALLRDDFHRAARALDVLEAEGRLARLAPTAPGQRPGLVAPLPDDAA